MTAFASVHIVDHRSVRQARGWRAQLAQHAPTLQGLRWLKAVTTLGDARKGGFAAVPPTRPRRQVAVAAWHSQEDFEIFYSDSPLASAWHDLSDHAWHVLLEPRSTNGSFHGARPFGEIETAGAEPGPIAVLTLGRCKWSRLAAFAREGTALTSSILPSAGLITALTAGFPVTGNLTFSLWEGVEDMRRFAYGSRGKGHRATIEADRQRGILEEQLTARFEPLAIRGSWDPGTTPNDAALGRLARALAARSPTPS